MRLNTHRVLGWKTSFLRAFVVIVGYVVVPAIILAQEKPPVSEDTTSAKSTKPAAAEEGHIKVFSLANGSALECSKLLNDLSFNARFTADLRTNSVIVQFMDEDQLQAIEAILLKLDERSSKPDAIEKVHEPTQQLQVIQRHTKWMVTREAIARLAIGSAEVADVVQLSATEIGVVGKGVGTTSLTLWFNKQPEPVSFHVNVTGEPSTTGLATPAAKQLVKQLHAQESAAAAEAATIRQLQANGQAEQNQTPIAEHQRKLKNLLSTAFDLKLQWEELQVKELQSRLSRLERQIGQRKELREKIINRRAGELIEGGALKWNADLSKARPSQPSPPQPNSSDERTFDGTPYSQWLKLLEDESNPAALRSALIAMNQVGIEGQGPRLARATLHALGRMYDKELNLDHDDDLDGSMDAAIMGVIEQLTAALVKQPTDVVVDALLAVAQEKTRSLGSRFALFTILGDILEDQRRGDVEAPFGHLRELVTKRANEFVKVLVDTRKERQDPEGPAFVSALQVVKISKRKIADFEGLAPFVAQQLAHGSFRMSADTAFAVFLLDIDPNYPGLIDFVLRLLRDSDRENGHDDLTPLLPRFGDKTKLFVPELVKLLQLRSRQVFDAGSTRQVFIQGDNTKQLAEALGTLGPIAEDALPLLREISATPLPTEGVFSEASKTKNQRQYEQSIKIVKTLKVAVDKAIEPIKNAPQPVAR